MRKKYGESRVDKCPFCGKRATTKNPQKVPVCRKHKDKYMNDLKCACGNWLDVCSGKWGAYFRCMDCGNINWKRGLEMNPHVREEKSEITVDSDEVDFI